jgi:hypothetical protein
MINKNRNPEKVNKLAVGSTATPADGDLLVSGNVGIGGAPVSLSGLTRFLHIADVNTPGIVLDDTNSTPWEAYNNGGKLYFSHNGATTPLSLDGPTGLATFSAGINLGNTASATATTLDGYEEGVFTVGTASDATGEFAGGGTNETGEYTRIGNCVYVRIAIRVGTNFTSNVLSGLPFGPVVDANVSSWTTLGVCLTGSATNSPIVAAVQNGAANIKFLNDSVTTSLHLPNTTHEYYRFSGFYYTTDAF